MPFTATVLTMFPEAFPGPLGVSLIGTAWREQDLWRLETVDIRAFSKDKRGFLDDTPAGGGPGQVLRADVIAAALDSDFATNVVAGLRYADGAADWCKGVPLDLLDEIEARPDYQCSPQVNLPDMIFAQPRKCCVEPTERPKIANTADR